MNVRKFFKSFHFAFQGFTAAFCEQNFRFHILAMIVVVIAGAFTGLSTLEWCMLCFVFGLVIGSEMINSAIERVVDLASPAIHPLAKQAKDLAAGAVLVFAAMSVIIGVLIFFPKWF